MAAKSTKSKNQAPEWERKPASDLKPNWSEIALHEASESVALHVLHEIVDRASGILYQRFLEKRVVPFAAAQVSRDVLALTQVRAV